MYPFLAGRWRRPSQATIPIGCRHCCHVLATNHTRIFLFSFPNPTRIVCLVDSSFPTIPAFDIISSLLLGVWNLQHSLVLSVSHGGRNPKVVFHRTEAFVLSNHRRSPRWHDRVYECTHSNYGPAFVPDRHALAQILV